MEKTVNGKSWKMEKAGRWKKLEKVENVNGRKWKRQKMENKKSVDIVP